MRDLLPLDVSIAVADHAAWHGALLPQEEACLGPTVVDARRREFAAGRVCARRALSELGIRGKPVTVGSHRQPIWPVGFVGSITHTTGYCAAAVAASSEILGLGIDAESNMELDQDLSELVLTREEQRCLATLNKSDAARARTVIFSAKESAFKLWWPLTEIWLDFQDVEIELYQECGAFTARIRTDMIQLPFPTLLHGSFAADAKLARTAITLLAP